MCRGPASSRAGLGLPCNLSDSQYGAPPRGCTGKAMLHGVSWENVHIHSNGISSFALPA